MTPSLRKRVLHSQLGPHGSWGFSPVGGNRSHSEGEPVHILSGRGLPGTLDGARGHPEKELPARPLRGFLAPALGSAVFPRANVREGQRSPERKTALRRSTRKVWCGRRRRVHPPLPRGWVAGAKCSRGPTVGREERKKRKGKKKESVRTPPPHKNTLPNDLFQFGILAVLQENYFWWIHPAALICM